MATGYDEFEGQARQMRDRFVAVATQEADKWLETTLAMIRRMSGLPIRQIAPVGGQVQHVDADITGHQGRSGGTLAEVARKVIASMGSTEFDSVQLRNMIEPIWGRMDNPTQRANLANLLRRMVERDELELVEQGTGARPSRFRRKAVKAAEMADTEHG
jgi:hypothetical protein